jgi:hypothetical protein
MIDDHSVRVGRPKSSGLPRNLENEPLRDGPFGELATSEDRPQRKRSRSWLARVPRFAAGIDDRAGGVDGLEAAEKSRERESRCVRRAQRYARSSVNTDTIASAVAALRTFALAIFTWGLADVASR